MVVIQYLHQLINDQDKIKPSLKESFNKYVEELRSQELNNKKRSRQLLKKLRNDVEKNKEDILLKVKAIGIHSTDKNKILEELDNRIKLTNTVNVNILEVSVEELPKDLQRFIQRQRQIKLKEQVKVRESNVAITEIRNELKSRVSIKKKQLDIIEPLPLFINLDFIESEEMRATMQKKLNLDNNLLPQNYDIFENFNTIKEKKHVTGEYHDYVPVKSKISKDFQKIEQKFIDVLNIDDFQHIPKELLRKYKHKLSEINSVFKIIHDFDAESHKDYSDNILIIMSKVFNDFLKEIPNVKGRQALSKYLLRAFDVLEVRKNTQINDQLFVKNSVLSNEKKGLMDNITQESIKVDKQIIPINSDTLDIENLQGDSLLSNDPEISHINAPIDDIGGFDDIFDDEDFENALL